MMRSLVSALLLVVLTILLIGESHDAHACGAFAGPRAIGDKELAASLPYLTVEQVLLVWDKDTNTEDFIRETRFDRANKVFGFVVPTPSKPEIAAVHHAPFAALRKAYAYDPPPPEPNSRGTGGAGAGATYGSGSGAAERPPVVVLSEQRIGSFKAFTISATDAGAFDKWLEDNGLAVTKEAKPWLEHYVALKFFFVALRYEPKAAAPTPEMTSETVRIRFKTPLPYYPYLEPSHPTNAVEADKRMLSGWLVTRSAMEPVACRVNAYGTRGSADVRLWSRPWTYGEHYDVSTAALMKAIGSEELRQVIPKAETLTVQTFRDLKPSREGWGDVVMVPEVPEEPDAATDEARKLFVPVIDPTLLEPDVAPVVASASPPPIAPAPATSSPAPKSHGCSMSSRGEGGSVAFFALVCATFAFVARRKSRLLVILLLLLLLPIACRRPTAGMDGGSDSSVYVSAEAREADSSTPVIKDPLGTREEREKNALAILRGDAPPSGIETGNQPTIAGGRGGVASVGASSIEGDGTIPDVDRVIAGLRARFRQCYQVGLNVDPSISGKVILATDIGPDGSVQSVTIRSNSGLSPAVATCCAGVVRRAQFAAPTGLGASKTAKVFIPVTFVQQQH